MKLLFSLVTITYFFCCEFQLHAYEHISVVRENLKDYRVECVLSVPTEKAEVRELSLRYTNLLTGSVYDEVVAKFPNVEAKSIYPKQKDDKIDPLLGARILSPALEKDEFAFVVELQTRENGYRPVVPLLRNHADDFLREWSGRNYLFKSYLRSEMDAWGPNLSAYLDTVWADVDFSKLSEVQLRGNDDYLFTFNGHWLLVGHIENRYSRKYKVFNEAGVTKKHLWVNKSDLLLTDMGKADSSFYVLGSTWWSTVDELNVSAAKGQSIFSLEKLYREKLRVSDVEAKEFIYIREIGANDLNPQKENRLFTLPVVSTRYEGN